MLSFKSKSMATIWSVSPKEKLYRQLTATTNRVILNHQKTDSSLYIAKERPPPIRQILFTASSVNLYLDKAYKDIDADCEEIAKTIYDFISTNVQQEKCAPFYNKLMRIIEPYLEPVTNNFLEAPIN